MKTYYALIIGILVSAFYSFMASADDRTMRVSVYGFYSFGNAFSPSTSVTATIAVSAGTSTNENPSVISFYVEYSDDLRNWTPLHSALDLTDTNRETTVMSTMTYDLPVLFFDPKAGMSSHRFYRSVEVSSP